MSDEYRALDDRELRTSIDRAVAMGELSYEDEVLDDLGMYRELEEAINRALAMADFKRIYAPIVPKLFESEPTFMDYMGAITHPVMKAYERKGKC